MTVPRPAPGEQLERKFGGPYRAYRERGRHGSEPGQE